MEKIFKIFLFAFWVNRPFRKRFAKNNWGPTLPGRARRVGRSQNQVRNFLLFFRFPGSGVGSFWVRICFVVFVCEFEPSAAVGFSFSDLHNLFVWLY
jgi:hypothetical protein